MPGHRSLPLPVIIVLGRVLEIIVYAALALPRLMRLGLHGFLVLRLNLDNQLTLICPRVLRDASIDETLFH
jgi:hypothetical protein